MTAEMKAAAAEAEARRGRKRGKHNFEPGYKDLLCKEWADFTAAHNRCPKLEEIEEFSKKSFLQRREELAEEDPDHPLLVILETPLDATQVKNLINNEKKKRQRMRHQDLLPQGSSLPFAALQGLPMNDAAAFMKEWLKKTAGQQASMAISDAQTLSPMSSPAPKFFIRQESTSVSDQSCDAGLQATPSKVPRSPPTMCETPISKARRPSFQNNNTLSNAVTTFQDVISEDESETHDSRLQDNKASGLSGMTSSMATFPRQHRRRLEFNDAVSPHMSNAEMGKIVQCTVAEALHKIMMKANQEEVHSSSIPVQMAPPSMMQSPPPLSLGPSAATMVASTTAGVAVQQSIANLAMNSCNQSLLPLLAQSLPVNVSQIQEVVKSIVEEQVQKVFAKQQLHAWQQKHFQEQQLAAQLRLQQEQQQQQQQQQDSSVNHLLSILQMLQASR